MLRGNLSFRLVKGRQASKRSSSGPCEEKEPGRFPKVYPSKIRFEVLDPSAHGLSRSKEVLYFGISLPFYSEWFDMARLDP